MFKQLAALKSRKRFRGA